MQLGCYGSSLAYSDDSTRCKRCVQYENCGSIVAERRPKLIDLMDQFRDGKGNSMALPWLTRAERKARKDKATAQMLATLYGGADVYAQLISKVDKRAQRMVSALAHEALNICTATIEQIDTVSPRIATVLAELTHKRLKVIDIEALLQDQHALTPSAARREAYSIKTLLIAAGRARQTGQFLETI